MSTFLFGILLGFAATSTGVTYWQTMLMSLSVYSATVQFSALEFWAAPLPLGTIALTVLLVSTRNILLGISMANHFDGHSVKRRILWLFLLNDPGVVTVMQMRQQVDKLGYVTGYGAALMVSWLLSTWLGLELAQWFQGADLASMKFAGPMVLSTIMILFVKGSKASRTPWITSGVVALMLYELNVDIYLILPLSVAAGVIVELVFGRRSDD